MAGDNSKYSDEQRQAIVEAVLLHGVSAAEAVTAAAQGALGLEPFEMPVSTAQEIVRKAKRDATLSGYEGRLEAMAGRVIERAEAELETALAGGFDHVKTRRAVQSAREAQRLVAQMRHADLPPAQRPDAAPPAAGVSDLIAELEADMDKDPPDPELLLRHNDSDPHSGGPPPEPAGN